MTSPYNYCNTYMITATLDYPAKIVFRVLNDPKYRARYDETIESTQILNKICINTYLWQHITKAKSGLIGGESARDFIAINYLYKNSKDNFMSVSWSDEAYEKGIPAGNKIVRGTMHLSGWLLKPKKSNKDKTEITLIEEIDPKISGLLSSGNKDNNIKKGKQIKKLNEIIGEYVKENDSDF